MLRDADPDRDVAEAIRRGDFRFIGVMGYAVTLPGVEDYGEQYQSYGVRIIEGTSDVIANDAVRLLNEQAYRYAERYNKLLMKHLNRK